jgi:hypothetical protein
MKRFLVCLLVCTLALSLPPPRASLAQAPTALSACQECAFSTEEDFLSRGPTPPDGNPIISDGDLLSCTGVVCARGADLVQQFDVTQDLGLDAVDILDVERGWVAFSTELDSPHGNFTEGDLLFTFGTAIPNQALLLLFQVAGDRGLDAVHFVGDMEAILKFVDAARSISRDDWLRNPGRLVEELERYGIDIWFSIEGTEMSAATVPILDGDLLSAAKGTVVASNDQLYAASVPAGIPNRGVDYGLDAVAAARGASLTSIRLSSEILYRGDPGFTDGDVLRYAGGIYASADSLTKPFEPLVDVLGTDAYYERISEAQSGLDSFVSLVLRMYARLTGKAP